MTGSLLQIAWSREAIVTSEIAFRLFQPSDAEAFRKLNEAWIALYFRLEEQDHIQLRNPEHNILRPGGQIVMAVAGEERIGCCALIFVRQGLLGGAKTAVSGNYHGHGLRPKFPDYPLHPPTSLR